MVTFAIDFQDGFLDDTVVLRINGQERFQREQVSTRLLLGLASSFTTEIEKGSLSVEISIPTRGLKESLMLDVTADTYIGVGIANGKLAIIISERPFGYG
jgi:hypothetical protein